MIRSKLAAIVCGLSAGAPVIAQDVCGPLTARPSFTRTTVVSASAVAAANGVPAFCEVQATISPVPGSKIGAVYRLPADWNGKVLGIGGGGFAGNVRVEAAAEGLTRGYAVLQNDMGHASPSALDPSFALDAQGKPQRRRHHRLRPSRHACRDGRRQGSRCATLRPRARARVLAGLLDGRPARARRSAAVSRRLRRRHRRRTRLHADDVCERDAARADVSRAARQQLDRSAGAADSRGRARRLRCQRRRGRQHPDRSARVHWDPAALACSASVGAARGLLIAGAGRYRAARLFRCDA